MTGNREKVIPLRRPSNDDSAMAAAAGLHHYEPSHDFDDQQWKHTPSIATVWMTTAIIISWSEGKTISLDAYLKLAPDMNPDIVRSYWHHAGAIAYMTAMATGLPVPAYQPGETA